MVYAPPRATSIADSNADEDHGIHNYHITSVSCIAYITSPGERDVNSLISPTRHQRRCQLTLSLVSLGLANTHVYYRYTRINASPSWHSSIDRSRSAVGSSKNGGLYAYLLFRPREAQCM